MGSLFSGPPKPSFNMPPPAAHPPTMGSAQVALAGINARKAGDAAEGMGFDNTIKTSSQGLTDKSTAAKATLLGQNG